MLAYNPVYPKEWPDIPTELETVLIEISQPPTRLIGKSAREAFFIAKDILRERHYGIYGSPETLEKFIGKLRSISIYLSRYKGWLPRQWNNVIRRYIDRYRKHLSQYRRNPVYPKEWQHGRYDIGNRVRIKDWHVPEFIGATGTIVEYSGDAYIIELNPRVTVGRYSYTLAHVRHNQIERIANENPVYPKEWFRHGTSVKVTNPYIAPDIFFGRMGHIVGRTYYEKEEQKPYYIVYFGDDWKTISPQTAVRRTSMRLILKPDEFEVVAERD